MACPHPESGLPLWPRTGPLASSSSPAPSGSHKASGACDFAPSAHRLLLWPTSARPQGLVSLSRAHAAERDVLRHSSFSGPSARHGTLVSAPRLLQPGVRPSGDTRAVSVPWRLRTRREEHGYTRVLSIRCLSRRKSASGLPLSLRSSRRSRATPVLGPREPSQGARPPSDLRTGMALAALCNVSAASPCGGLGQSANCRGVWVADGGLNRKCCPRHRLAVES